MQVRNLTDEPITLTPGETIDFAGFTTNDDRRVVITDADEIRIVDA